MKKWIALISMVLSTLAFTKPCHTQRKIFIDNANTKVWKTTLCPSQKLAFHTHHYPRVLIPNETGALEVFYQSGKKTLISLIKQKPLYLSAYQGKEPHTDRILGQKSLDILVVEMKQN